MADELLRALGKRQRELDEGPSPLADAVGGDAGEALLDDLFGQLDAKAEVAESKPDNVAQLPRRRSTIWVVAGAVVAAAAALVLWFARPAPVETQLPAYSLDLVEGGPATVRGAPSNVEKVLELDSPHDSIEVRLSPAAPMADAIDVSLLATKDDGTSVFTAAVDVPVSGSGSIHMRGPLDDFIVLPAGHWTLELVVSPAGTGPTSEEEARDARWQRLPIQVIIHAP